MTRTRARNSRGAALVALAIALFVPSLKLGSASAANVSASVCDGDHADGTILGPSPKLGPSKSLRPKVVAFTMSYPASWTASDPVKISANFVLDPQLAKGARIRPTDMISPVQVSGPKGQGTLSVFRFDRIGVPVAAVVDRMRAYYASRPNVIVDEAVYKRCLGGESVLGIEARSGNVLQVSWFAVRGGAMWHIQYVDQVLGSSFDDRGPVLDRLNAMLNTWKWTTK